MSAPAFSMFANGATVREWRRGYVREWAQARRTLDAIPADDYELRALARARLRHIEKRYRAFRADWVQS